MVREILIAALAAGYALRIPWFAVCDVATKIVIWANLTICLLFFCLFLEEKHEKWQKKQTRVQRMREIIARLREEQWHAENE